ncbi:MAG: hypothetical protein J5654_05605 [Victivallales bacterium]|nr:hypothetical protein [Victivallales bacterium]
MKNKVLLCLAVSVLVNALVFADQPEWERRPLEIINGTLPAPHCPTLWNAEEQGIDAWKVDGDATLALSDDVLLWNDHVAKLTVNSAPARVVLVPTKDIVLAEGIDGLELWLYGFQSGRATVSFEVLDAAKRRHTVKTTGNSSYWAGNPWWCTTLGRLPAKAKLPAKVTKVIFDIPEGIRSGDAMYFDFLGNFSLSDEPLKADNSAPFPAKPESILPTPADAEWTNALTTEDGRYLFTCQGTNGSVTYAYTPQTGTLDDLEVMVDGAQTFRPMVGGGLRAEVGGMSLAPVDDTTQATLLDCVVVDDTLHTSWRIAKGEDAFEYSLDFTVIGRSLVISATSESTAVTAFDCGHTEGTPTPRLFGLTYLNYRWDYPRILVTDDYFVSLFPDWYTSQASEVVDGGSNGGLAGAAVLSENSARILGGSLYLKKARGERNPMRERFFLTVAPDLESVLPNLPNPRSEYFDETKTLVYSTRMYDSLDVPASRAEVEFWRLMADYGLTDIYVRYHSHQFRTPVRSNRICRSLDAYAGVGDEAYQNQITELKKILRRVGVYQDNRVTHPLGPEFSYDILVQWTSGNFNEGWDCQFQPSPAAIPHLEEAFVPKFLAKFPWNACYYDEVDNTPPWGLVDYSPNVEGAATYHNVLSQYAVAVATMRRLFQGPIWSEGNAAFFWAGYLDTDYAQCNQADALPMVDFKLRKMNPLENLNGYDLTKVGNASNDYMLSAQIVHGNMGHLWNENRELYAGSNLITLQPEDFRRIAKTYYMMRQLQECYAGVEPEEILYQCGDELLSATEMLRGNRTNEGKVYVRYANDLEVWVNRHPEADWTIEVDGAEMALPPYGYAAFLPGRLLEYSALVDGHRVDYSRGPLYTYVDGRGVRTAFPEVTCENAYVFHKAGDAKTLTPVPFIQAESLGGISATRLTRLARDGQELGPEAPLDLVDAGKARFTTDAEAFRYRLK